MATKPVLAHKCTKVFNIINLVSSYIFCRSCGHPQGGALQRIKDGYIEIVQQMDISR